MSEQEQNAKLIEIAKEHLLLKMGTYSEDMWCAGWMMGLEYECWPIPEFRELGELCGGWWIWRDKDNEFISLDEWKTLYEAKTGKNF